MILSACYNKRSCSFKAPTHYAWRFVPKMSPFFLPQLTFSLAPAHPHLFAFFTIPHKTSRTLDNSPQATGPRPRLSPPKAKPPRRVESAAVFSADYFMRSFEEWSWDQSVPLDDKWFLHPLQQYATKRDKGSYGVFASEINCQTGGGGLKRQFLRICPLTAKWIDEAPLEQLGRVGVCSANPACSAATCWISMALNIAWRGGTGLRHVPRLIRSRARSSLQFLSMWSQ